MKLVSIVFLCLFFSLAARAQTPENSSDNQTTTSNRTTPNAVGIREIYLAKDDGEGKPGVAETKFMTTDIPIFCVVQLDSLKPATVKMNFIAVKVDGVKPETKVVTVSFKTNGKQSRVYFTGSPADNWIAGNYRVDVFVDGKLGGSRELEIQRAATINPAINTFQLLKTPAKIKPKKQPRKN